MCSKHTVPFICVAPVLSRAGTNVTLSRMTKTPMFAGSSLRRQGSVAHATVGASPAAPDPARAEASTWTIARCRPTLEQKEVSFAGQRQCSIGQGPPMWSGPHAMEAVAGSVPA